MVQRVVQLITITQGNSVNHKPNFKVFGSSKILDKVQVKLKNNNGPQWVLKWGKLKNL